MNAVVFKYQLPSFDAEISMPEGARTIHCGMQNGKITLWAIVNPGSNSDQPRKFLVVGTGDVLHLEWRLVHVGTVFDGPHVWHVFEDAYI